MLEGRKILKKPQNDVEKEKNWGLESYRERGKWEREKKIK